MERKILYTTREEALEAVKQNGCALECASDKLKNDREIVLTIKRVNSRRDYDI